MRASIVAIVLVSILRLLFAARYPLTNDEAYYWLWSRHLAFGYVDHPPAVAWFIAVTSFLPKDPFFIRLPFVLCEAIAAYAVGRTAFLLANDPRSATAATFVFLCIPQGRLQIGAALPDGPYLLFWALSLLFAARVAKWGKTSDVVMLGITLGGALLSRIFGLVLIAGIAMYFVRARERGTLERLWVTLAIALLVYSPFLVWNAAHDWANFRFTFHDRQALHTFSMNNVLLLSSLRFLLFGLLFSITAYFTTMRAGSDLLTWTAVPFVFVLAALAFFQGIESYYILGPLVSLSVGIGIALMRARLIWRRLWLAVGSVSMAFAFVSVGFVTLAENQQAHLLRTAPGLTRPFYSLVFAYAPLSNDIRRMAGSTAAPLSDRLEIASELTYNGILTRLIGPAPQIRQWNQWFENAPPEKAIVITFEPPYPGTPLWHRLRAAYFHIHAGPALHYEFAGVPSQTFYSTWCTNPTRGASMMLFQE